MREGLAGYRRSHPSKYPAVPSYLLLIANAHLMAWQIEQGLVAVTEALILD
jgi:hypothetical protein